MPDSFNNQSYWDYYNQNEDARIEEALREMFGMRGDPPNKLAEASRAYIEAEPKDKDEWFAASLEYVRKFNNTDTLGLQHTDGEIRWYEPQLTTPKQGPVELSPEYIKWLQSCVAGRD